MENCQQQYQKTSKRQQHNNKHTKIDERRKICVFGLRAVFAAAGERRGLARTVDSFDSTSSQTSTHSNDEAVSRERLWQQKTNNIVNQEEVMAPAAPRGHRVLERPRRKIRLFSGFLRF
jgi:hypothetical protein